MQNQMRTVLANAHDGSQGQRVKIGPKVACNAPPELHVQKKDGRIETIVVSCPCGEQITIHCDYAHHPAAVTAS